MSDSSKPTWTKPPVSTEIVRDRTSEELCKTIPFFDDKRPNKGYKERPSTDQGQNFEKNPFEEQEPSNDHADEDSWEDQNSEEGDVLLRKAPNKSGQDSRVDRTRRYSGRYLGQLGSDTTSASIMDASNTLQEVDFAEPKSLSHEQLVKLVHRLRSELQSQKLLLNHNRQLLLQQATSKHPGLSDDVIAKRMSFLRNEVFQWASNFFYASVTFGDTSAQDFGHLSRNYKVYLASPSLRPWLIQARLWDMLQENIFEDKSKYYGYVWAGGITKRRFYNFTRNGELIGRNMESLDALLSPGRKESNDMIWKEYLEWRALTFNLLFPGSGSNIHPKINPDEIREQIDLVTRTIWKSLQKYVRRNSKLKKPMAAKSDLREIVKQAILLDLDFQKQMAEIEVDRVQSVRSNSYGVPLQFGFPFTTEDMLDLGGKSAGNVEIIVSPALWKSRDWSAGTHQGEERCLLRAEVFCQIPPSSEPTQPKKRRSKVASSKSKLSTKKK